MEMEDLLYFGDKNSLQVVKGWLETEFPRAEISEVKKEGSTDLILKISLPQLLQDNYILFALRKGFMKCSLNMNRMKDEKNPYFLELVNRVASEFRGFREMLNG